VIVLWILGAVLVAAGIVAMARKERSGLVLIVLGLVVGAIGVWIRY
jgi:hypothetical protein